jgi:hypothetical protein
MDIGGGTGTVLSVLLQAHSQLSGVLSDRRALVHLAASVPRAVG